MIMCCIPGCKQEGMVLQMATNRWYCVDHAWSDDEVKRIENESELEVKNVIVPPIDDSKFAIATKKHLEDVGPRFQHLADFQDYLADGLVAVTNSLSRYQNDVDFKRKASLEGALNFVRVYQEQLADFTKQKWAFNKMLDECVPTREVMSAIKADRIKAAYDKKNAEIYKAQTGADPSSLLGSSDGDASDCESV